MSKGILIGSDTLTLQNRTMTDLIDGDVINITYPNNLADSVTGKNNNSIVTLNSTGVRAEVVVRLLLGSADDRFLNGLMKGFELDPATFILLAGTLAKRTGDGIGAVTRVLHTLKAGYFSKRIETVVSADGNTEQGVAIYNLVFTTSTREIT